VKVIHKFLLRNLGEVCAIKLPAGSFVTRIGIQDKLPYAWVYLDTSIPYDQPCEFLIVGTGSIIQDGFWPVTTFDDGAFVWHGCMRIGQPYLTSKIPA
jgi:hypothetical protein